MNTKPMIEQLTDAQRKALAWVQAFTQLGGKLVELPTQSVTFEQLRDALQSFVWPTPPGLLRQEAEQWELDPGSDDDYSERGAFHGLYTWVREHVRSDPPPAPKRWGFYQTQAFALLLTWQELLGADGTSALVNEHELLRGGATLSLVDLEIEVYELARDNGTDPGHVRELVDRNTRYAKTDELALADWVREHVK